MGPGYVEGFLKDIRFKRIHKRMRRWSSPTEEGKGSMFRAGRSARTRSQRCHSLRIVRMTRRYESNSPGLEARI